jgi:hypothetical protein
VILYILVAINVIRAAFSNISSLSKLKFYESLIIQRKKIFGILANFLPLKAHKSCNLISSYRVTNNNFIIFRRRKGEKIFLVAFYECNEDFEMENVDQDRLYCSNEQWVAVDFDEDNTPKCVAVNEDDNEDEEEGAFENTFENQ